MPTYLAESVPAPGVRAARPLDDHDAAMSAPKLVDHGPDERTVRHSLAMHLIHQTSGMAADRQKTYFAASTAITEGVDAVQISGRVYRIRTKNGA